MTGSPETGSGRGSGLVRIEAASYREALEELRTRFGDSVQIVSTRRITRKGVMGVLGATGVEVYVLDRSRHKEYLQHQIEQGNVPPTGTAGTGVSATGLPRTGTADGQFPPRVTAASGPDLLPMLEELQSTVRQLVRDQGVIDDAPDTLHGAVDAGIAGGVTDDVVERGSRKGKSSDHAIVLEARRILNENGFSSEVAEEILERIRERDLPRGIEDSSEVYTLARIQLGDVIRPKIPPCMPISPVREGGVPRVVAMVGPTGVGKTTTIAKLASTFQLSLKKKVGLITLDTYRIGAVDQLQKYGEIMGVSLAVVEQGGSVHEAIESFRDKDIVLIDTAGRSQRDARRLAEVRDMLNGLGSLEVHLCTSLATSRDTLLDVAKNFRIVPYNRILITKLDESARHGALIDLFAVARVPVSYITCGQEVPDDIHPASVEHLEKMLLGG